MDAKTDVWLGGRKSAVLGEELGSSFLVPLLRDVALLEAGVLAQDALTVHGWDGMGAAGPKSV